MELRDELLLYTLRLENKRDEKHEAQVIATLCKKIDTLSLRLLARIREIIRDPDLDDGACFEKIEEIVCLFEEYGIAAGTRHDFG